MRRILFFAYITIAVAILVALTLPLINHFVYSPNDNLPFDNKVFQISPIFVIGLILVFALKFYTHESDEPSDKYSEKPGGIVGTFVGWSLALVAGGAIGFLASNSVAAALCKQVWKLYC